MTVPKLRTVKKGGSRFYVHPEDSKYRVPGVTSIIDVLPKPWLAPWSAKMVAESAVENIGSVVGIVANGDRGGAVDYLKRAPYRSKSSAADVGSEAHDVWERMAKGGSPGRVDELLQPFVQGFTEFLDRFQPEFLFLEESVWSATHGYAGSFDWLARIEGEVVMGDNKTTRSGVHDEVGLQLNAYANADYILYADGKQVRLPEVDAAAVFHCRPDGWRLTPVRLGEDIFKLFLSLIPVFGWEKLKKTCVGDPIVEVGFDVA